MPTKPQPAPKPKPQILMAEDDPFISRMYELKLSEAGYDLTLVNSGSAAIDRIAAIKPDLIIMDINLAELSGFQVIETLKDQNYDFTKTKLLFLTNSVAEKDASRAAALGGEYMTKIDSTPRAVLEKIQQILDGAPPSGS